MFVFPDCILNWLFSIKLKHFFKPNTKKITGVCILNTKKCLLLIKYGSVSVNKTYPGMSNTSLSRCKWNLIKINTKSLKNIPPLTKFPDFSLTFGKNPNSLTFPWLSLTFLFPVFSPWLSLTVGTLLLAGLILNADYWEPWYCVLFMVSLDQVK